MSTSKAELRTLALCEPRHVRRDVDPAQEKLKGAGLPVRVPAGNRRHTQKGRLQGVQEGPVAGCGPTYQGWQSARGQQQSCASSPPARRGKQGTWAPESVIAGAVVSRGAEQPLQAWCEGQGSKHPAPLVASHWASPWLSPAGNGGKGAQLRNPNRAQSRVETESSGSKGQTKNAQHSWTHSPRVPEIHIYSIDIFSVGSGCMTVKHNCGRKSTWSTLKTYTYFYY